ncbi:MAG: HD domain-containing protein [Lachnospiraceae bacterium]|nr:HD domain-containing protein [Lachnospiraceae bacterium]MDD7076966.1 HD domain-containing protein [Lachnospiraceae bacterium]MDY3729497.1 HD domain-containing protein [Candidatus Choladocola sp.]
MERIHKIWEHPLYQEQFQALQKAESERIFCNHTLEHFLDVARIAYIQNLETGAGLSKVLIYAAALLHDIGRYRQIAHGIPHEKASTALAERIMSECNFTQEEIHTVCESILNHRGSTSSSDGTTPKAALEKRSSAVEDSCQLLSQLLYRADKLSRNCFSCPAEGECNWSIDKKNRRITI